jgi:hypothetical protein
MKPAEPVSFSYVERRFEQLRDYLIEDRPNERRSLGMFMDMVSSYKRLAPDERAVRRDDFLGLIRRIEDVVCEEYGASHVVAGVAHEYLTGVRR